jgi:antitoxin HigA-1
MRLARYFGGDAQSWLNLQTLYDLRIAEKANASKIEKQVTPLASSRLSLTERPVSGDPLHP